ncbi:hypothetical protein NDI45_29845 [Leptolyngbya sp. GB1-A1]|uniref:hypothetical protein n=1 Tax=Leptolyngbya sp. GB1-A1 TaxID=2933908 RepID=UPI003296D191
MNFASKYFKYLLLSLLVLSIIMLSGLAVVAQSNDDNLGVAYIRPRTLVYARGNFWVYADNAFDDSQKRLIRSASEILHDRMRTQRSRILDCAYRRSNRFMPASRQRIDSQLISVFVNAASGNRPIKLTTTDLWTAPRRQPNGVTQYNTGRAPIGNPGQFPEQGDLLRVALNSVIVDRTFSDFPQARQADRWAGTLVHEVLHNLGYDHERSGSTDGAFVKEFGTCTAFNGNIPDGLQLTDSNVEVIE